MDQAVIDANLFRKRLKKLTTTWTLDVDAILLVTGKNEELEGKAQTMHHWLLGYAFPETAIALSRSGKAIFLSSAKKLAVLKQIEAEDVSLIERVAGNPESDHTCFVEMFKSVRGDKPKAVLGILQKETDRLKGPLVDACLKALESEQSSLETVECREAISSLLACKDDQELDLVRKSSQLAMAMMKAGVIRKVEEIIDKDDKKGHSTICREVEELLDNQAILDKWKVRHGLDPSELDLVYTMVQSGGQYDLRPNAVPTDDNLAMQGMFLLSVGTKYTEYSACLTRTLLIDPTKEQKQTYTLAIEVFNTVVQALKPGVAFKEVFLKGRDVVQRKNPTLLEEVFMKSVGFGMGIEFKDPMMVLSEKSDCTVQQGMVFCVSVGFHNQGGEKKWAIWLCDTVVITATGAENLTADQSKQAEDVMYELDNEAESAAKDKVKDKRAPPAPTRTDKPKPDKKQERTRERTTEERIPTVNTNNILESRLRTRNAQTKQDMDEQFKLEQKQIELRAKKLQELHERFSGQGPRGDETQVSRKLSSYVAYSSQSKLPAEALPRRLMVDTNAEAVIVPVNGMLVPFHARTIRNMSTKNEGTQFYLRINFFLPGQGKTADEFPAPTPTRLFIKELSLKSTKNDNFMKVVREFQELRKRMKEKETEKEVADLKPQMTLELHKGGQPPVLRDVNMRPTFAARGRSIGNLVAHTNGFRFATKRGEQVDIIYSNIKHAVFEPCENNIIVLVHLRLKDPIMIGRKKTVDVQFFTEVVAQAEDLTQRRAGSMHDPDEVLEEQRERELRSQLNKVFKDFVDKVQELKAFRIEFDMPYRELDFYGVPNKSQVVISPCRDVLISLQEWPPFLLPLADIDICVIERFSYQLRAFDLAFVKKDYDKEIVKISTISSRNIDQIKQWLGMLECPWYTSPMNMAWPKVMAEIRKDLPGFAEQGGWNNMFDEGSSSEDAEEGGNDGDDGSDFEADEGEEDEEIVSDGDEDFSAASENSSDFDPDDDSEESGLSWDELEKRAEKDDHKARTRSTAAPPPNPKRQRRS